IRVAQYQPGYTRVVLEVADVSDYSAFLLPNPYRLIIDIHGRQPHSQSQAAAAGLQAGLDDDELPTTGAAGTSSSAASWIAKPAPKPSSGISSQKKSAPASKPENGDKIASDATAQPASS